MSTLAAFRRDLEDLINEHSMENGSDTPDFMLAEFMTNCMTAYNGAVVQREMWFGGGAESHDGCAIARSPSAERKAYWLGCLTGASAVVMVVLGSALGMFGFALWEMG